MEGDLCTGSYDIKTCDDAHIDCHLIKMSNETNTKENTDQDIR